MRNGPRGQSRRGLPTAAGPLRTCPENCQLPEGLEELRPQMPCRISGETACVFTLSPGKAAPRNLLQRYMGSVTKWLPFRGRWSRTGAGDVPQESMEALRPRRGNHGRRSVACVVLTASGRVVPGPLRPLPGDGKCFGGRDTEMGEHRPPSQTFPSLAGGAPPRWPLGHLSLLEGPLAF